MCNYKEKYLEVQCKYDRLKQAIDDENYDNVTGVLESYFEMNLELAEENRRLKHMGTFVGLLEGCKTEEEKEALEKIFQMMLTLHQQILLRKLNEACNK